MAGLMKRVLVSAAVIGGLFGAVAAGRAERRSEGHERRARARRVCRRVELEPRDSAARGARAARGVGAESAGSLADDAAATKRTVDAQKGPVVLVGHSWAGVVISEAGNDDKVKSLVYVAAFAPDNGQSIADVTQGCRRPRGPVSCARMRAVSRRCRTRRSRRISPRPAARAAAHRCGDAGAVVRRLYLGEGHAGRVACEAVDVRRRDAGQDDRPDAAGSDGEADRRDGHARERQPCVDAEPAEGRGRRDHRSGRAREAGCAVSARGAALSQESAAP